MNTTSTSGGPFSTAETEGFEQPARRRFVRSTKDRKIAGVAGGIGRALGVDPMLIRISFAVLTIFGGTGVALYAAGWLLMPAEHDEVSPLEGLLGRGHSSTSPVMSVILGLVVVGSITTGVTWGLPLLPIAIVAAVVFFLFGRKSHRLYTGGRSAAGVDWSDRAARKEFGERAGRQAQDWAEQFSRRAQEWGEDVGRRAQAWGDRVGRRSDGWSGQVGGRNHRPGSSATPFAEPPAWERADHPVDLTKESTVAGRPDTTAAPTPPSWDPLGAAPFAWDLPEPGPLPTPPAVLRSRRRAMLAAALTATTAVALLGIGGLGQWQGWWNVRLAVISGIALAFVAVAILLSALRGRRSPLIGFGVLLAIVTGFLTTTQMTGHGGIGDRTITPTSISEVQRTYRLDAGSTTLDLSHLAVPAGQSIAVDVEVGAGDANVTLPRDVTSTVSCTANLGSVECLGQQDDGVATEVTTSTTGSGSSGTIQLRAHVGTGEVRVTTGDK